MQLVRQPPDSCREESGGCRRPAHQECLNDVLVKGK